MTMDATEAEALADRIAHAGAEIAALAGRGGRDRHTDVVDGIRVTASGVRAAWGNQAHVVDEPDAAALAAALGWLRERGDSFGVRTRERWATHPLFASRGLAPLATLPVLTLELASWSPPKLRAEGQIAAPRDPEEFVAAYAGGFAMAPELAAALVAEADLAAPAYVHLVARVDGVTVGTAMLRVADGCGCVSAVGVLPAYRRRGIGGALTAAATTAAGERGCDIGFLHATGAGRGVYERLGYRLVDVHVDLGSSP